MNAVRFWSIVGTSLFLASISEGAEAKPLLNFESASASVNENGGSLEIRATLTAPLTRTLYIYMSRNGSASGSDYSLSSSSFRFNPGQTAAAIQVAGRNDNNVEPNEELQLRFNSNSNVDLGPSSQMSISIVDDDQAPPSGGGDVALQTTCSVLFGSPLVNYCVHRTPGSQNPDRLFYFHGAYGNQNFWTSGLSVEYRAGLRRYWADNNLDAPTVVVISLGFTWLLTETPSNGKPALLPYVADQVIPQIETLHSLNQPGSRRLLGGLSMGGFNALQLYLKRPQMWDRAVITAALIPLCDPFLPSSQLTICVMGDAYNSSFFQANAAHGLVKTWFPTPGIWDRADPELLANEILDSSFPPILDTTGTNDEFGFMRGNESFAQIAIQKGVDMTWAPTDCIHGCFDAATVGEFLLAR